MNTRLGQHSSVAPPSGARTRDQVPSRRRHALPAPGSAFARRPRSLRGFTLIEVCLAMAIGVLILGVAVLGMGGLQAESKLKKMASDVEKTARDSLLRAVMEQRPVQVDFSAASLGGEGRLQVKRYGDAGFRAPQRGEIWEFSPTGICEPVEVRVMNSVGVIELGFDPLTGCAVRKSLIVNG